ncbi:hypothetical protein CHF27_011090 [Romboutsia maritimum]|uniref:Uncharacterized protein n=1 Tax=Romboutsia maritimum TaxID=2020948 RepID=A0A371IQW8_9FIRM|nr:hypothetical protein [Romboutsia maritimum]RDY22858.1 hypothetical protein CHF27_011090 [Romboutsia maritimum]
MKLPFILRKTHDKEMDKLVQAKDEIKGWYMDLMDEVIALRKINVEKQNKINMQDKVIDKLETTNCEVIMDKFRTETELKEAEKKIQDLEWCLKEFKKVKKELEEDNIKLMQQLSKTSKYKALG